MTHHTAFKLQSIAVSFRRPWSVENAFYVAIIVGLAAPMLNGFLFALLHWTTAPFAFFLCLALMIASLYWLVDRTQFRRDWRAMAVTFGAGLLWTAGALASGWCCSTHVCMAGHMDHPPYPTWHYAADASWPGVMALAAIWMRAVRASVCLAFAVLTFFIISYRFVFGSFGGMYIWLPL